MITRCAWRLTAPLLIVLTGSVLTGCKSVQEKVYTEKVARGDALLASGASEFAEEVYREAVPLAAPAHVDTALLEKKIERARRASMESTIRQGEAWMAKGDDRYAMILFERARDMARQIDTPVSAVDDRVAGARRATGNAALSRGDILMARHRPVAALDAYARSRQYAEAAGIPKVALDHREARALELAKTGALAEAGSYVAEGNPGLAHSTYVKASRYAASAGLPTAPYDEGAARTLTWLNIGVARSHELAEIRAASARNPRVEDDPMEDLNRTSAGAKPGSRTLARPGGDGH